MWKKFDSGEKNEEEIVEKNIRCQLNLNQKSFFCLTNTFRMIQEVRSQFRQSVSLSTWNSFHSQWRHTRSINSTEGSYPVFLVCVKYKELHSWQTK